MTTALASPRPTDRDSPLSESPARRRRLVSWRFRRDAGPALGLSAAQERHVAEVNRRVASGAYRLERGRCCCGSDLGDVVAEVDRYGIELDTVLCAACGTLRFDPYPDAASLGQFYRAQYQEMYARVPDPDAYFVRQRGYGQRVLERARHWVPPGGVVAEVGCGAGGGLAVFREAGFETHGCDHSTTLIEFGQRRGLPGLSFGDIDALAVDLDRTDRKADLIFLHHVFEHLGAPEAWLKRAASLLAPNGMIVVAVPDVATIDRHASPGGDLRLFLHVAHKFNFTIAGLHALAAAVDLQAWQLDVEPSGQAPELWFAFAPRGAVRRGESPQAAWSGSSAALFDRLRSIEWRYVRAAAWRKGVRLLRWPALRLGRLLGANRPGR